MKHIPKNSIFRIIVKHTKRNQSIFRMAKNGNLSGTEREVMFIPLLKWKYQKYHEISILVGGIPTPLKNII